MKLEAVIVCIDFADILSHTLPYTKTQFDRLVVVTDTQDKDTKRVCEIHNVKCVQTNAFYANGETVANKAAGINEGLKALALDGWVVQLDADIYLPAVTKSLIKTLSPNLDKTKLYGIDRFMCDSWEEWYAFLHKEYRLLYKEWVYVDMSLFPVGDRMVQYKGDGWWNIGFFQMWCPKESGIYDYPVEMEGYNRTDVIHQHRWPRHKKELLPDIVCIHITSKKHEKGQNWKGRGTPPFGPQNYELGESIKRKQSFIDWLFWWRHKHHKHEHHQS